MLTLTHVTDPVSGAHVLRCENPLSRYETSKTGHNSVVIPVMLSKETSALQQTELFKVMCFSSCTGGINRRSLDLVITLEHAGVVLCTQTVPIRVCACPGRDRKAIERSSAARVLTTIRRSDSSGAPGGSLRIIPKAASDDERDEAEGARPQPHRQTARAPQHQPQPKNAIPGSIAGVRQIVTTIDKQLPDEEDDQREYIVQVCGVNEMCFSHTHTHTHTHTGPRV